MRLRQGGWLEITAGDSHLSLLTAGGCKTLFSQNGFRHLDSLKITGGHNEYVSSQQVFL